MVNEMTAALMDAITLIRDAVAGLTKDACLTCGAEPGCNIDCAGCDWVVRARRFLAEEDESGPKDWDTYFAGLERPASGAGGGQTGPLQSTGVSAGGCGQCAHLIKTVEALERQLREVHNRNHENP